MQLRCTRLLPELIHMTWSSGTTRARHAYLLIRPRGNVLFHGPERAQFYERQRGLFERCGGVQLHALTHANEASRAAGAVTALWGAPLYVHAADRLEAARAAPSARIATFSRSHSLGSDLRAIHLPGHTPGFTAFVWRAPSGERYLFGGDIVSLRGVRWSAYAHVSELGVARRSLRRLLALEVDWFLPNQTPRGERLPLSFGRAERERAVDQALAALAARYAQPARPGKAR
jgi:glyoxylase-like metal-dependent hydrolase (beta-lactamase superfamily II)